MTEGPVKIGGLVEKTVGQLYHDQMLAEYIQANEQITLNAMVMLCLAAREFDDRAMFVILTASDQGDWMDAAGVASALPSLPGDFSAEGDLDPDGTFDDEGWASSLDERTRYAWEPFCQVSLPMPHWAWLDVDKVLAEVALPWRTSADAHGPVPATWFARGVWPTCRCGLDPRDNGVLTAHWREYGFEVVDDHGRLIRQSL